MKILIIDDEQSLLKLLSISLKSSSREIVTAETAAQGIQAFQESIFDLVLCDIGLPDQDGIQVLKALKEIRSNCPIVMITAHGSIESALQAMKIGAYDYIQKPFEPEEIEIVIERAIRGTQLLEDYARLRSQVESDFDFKSILGNSAPMKKLFERMRKAADTKSTVLIMGESGTGKELLAKAIHFNSPRKNKPFVVVDCGAIPANLLESELFGHLKGAFTGADSTKKGLCEEAHGGTLFLDEIGELPLELQSKILRFLQESTLRRVGDTKTLEVDVRIIAATNRDLLKEVEGKRFREDLYYRLNVVPLTPPPLRQRREDIALLSFFFLKKYAKAYARKIDQIHPEVLSRLHQFDWPGNVRQLENVIEQMVVMTEGSSLQIDALPPPLSQQQPAVLPNIPEAEWDLKEALSRVQRYTEEFMIRRALEKTHFNKTKAAELLGVSRRSLITKTQEYHIEAGSEDALD